MKLPIAAIIFAAAVLLTGCETVSPQVRTQQLQAYVNSHPELSAADKADILGRKMFIGLPLEAAQLMSDMRKVDGVVSEHGAVEHWNNGWFHMYFRNGKLVRWRESTPQY